MGNDTNVISGAVPSMPGNPGTKSSAKNSMERTHPANAKYS